MGIVENQVRPRSEAGAEGMDLRDASGILSDWHRDKEEGPHLLSSFFVAEWITIH